MVYHPFITSVCVCGGGGYCSAYEKPSEQLLPNKRTTETSGTEILFLKQTHQSCDGQPIYTDWPVTYSNAAVYNLFV